MQAIIKTSLGGSQFAVCLENGEVFSCYFDGSGENPLNLEGEEKTSFLGTLLDRAEKVSSKMHQPHRKAPHWASDARAVWQVRLTQKELEFLQERVIAC